MKAKTLFDLILESIWNFIMRILNFILYPFRKVFSILFLIFEKIFNKLFENVDMTNFIFFFGLSLLVVYAFYQVITIRSNKNE